MLSITGLSLQFGERVLFKDLSLTLSPHDRIGLVGSNGTGKSTLLKFITGIQEADAGRINKSHAVTVGYLPQDGVTVQGRTLYGEAESAFENILAVQEECEEVRQALETLDPSSPEYAETLEMFGELHHKLDELDAYRMRSKVERVLTGLGFSSSDMERMTEEFSGGWQMRIALAKLLLQEPFVLLLDEPTNHLDLDSLEWLEEYLRSYHGAVVLVSHDRSFLDNLTTRTIALSRGRVEEYAGNYSFYERERGARRDLLTARMRNQQSQIKQTQEFIDRFRYKATKARQVQSRIKMLDRMDRIEVETEEEEIHFSFPPPTPSGRIVVELRDLVKRYGIIDVFDRLDLKIERGDKIAVVGVNGAGKSTLARILAGIEPITGGERVVGSNVRLSYFGQHQADELDLSKEVLQTIDEIAEGEIRKKLRTILGSFLFHGDDVYKRVSVLSGGEKSRLALARMLLAPANFLIMDEPTNHLDMRSKSVLQEALQTYQGTYFIVSHDRAFLDPIVNKVLEIQKGHSTVYRGSMSDYLAKKHEQLLPASRPLTANPAPVRTQTARGNWQNQQQEKRAAQKGVRAMKRKAEEAEQSIESLEQRKAELEGMLASPDLYRSPEKAKSASVEYQDLQKRLEDAYWNWGEIQRRMEGLD